MLTNIDDRYQPTYHRHYYTEVHWICELLLLVYRKYNLRFLVTVELKLMYLAYKYEMIASTINRYYNNFFICIYCPSTQIANSPLLTCSNVDQSCMHHCASGPIIRHEMSLSEAQYAVGRSMCHSGHSLFT